ncbi:Retinol dehydrogenase 7 [Halotydeus destructor]|nr:Retinol dehydrogenase 7 [Halotydeus destructor]
MPRVDAADKCVLVTGCDSGFGHLTAKSLANKGFHVFAGCLFPDGPGAEALSSLENISVFSMDITDEASVLRSLRTVEQSMTKTGKSFHGVVNNAGIAAASLLEWGDKETFAKVHQVNSLGGLLVTRTFLPLLRKDGGRIVNIGSQGSRATFPFLGAYNSSKAVVRNLTFTLRAELAVFGVKVVLIEPASFRTSLTDYGNMRALIDQTWSRTDPDVKETYGQSTVDLIRFILNTSAFFADYIDLGRSGDCNMVVSAIEDALMSYEPKGLYSPGALLTNLGSSVVFNLPQEVLDFVSCIYVGSLIYGGHFYQRLAKLMTLKEK